nr:MAG TPA: hypothetical protein [Bacteriophage sp.]
MSGAHKLAEVSRSQASARAISPPPGNSILQARRR